MTADVVRTCPDEGTFLDLLWGHPWQRAQFWAQEDLANYGGGDPQPPLMRLNAPCPQCSGQLHLTVAHDMTVHKALYTPGSNPDSLVYFRRSGPAMLLTGEDEYNGIFPTT